MRFPRQEYWMGLPFPSPRDLFNPGIEPTPPALANVFLTTEPLGKPLGKKTVVLKNILSTLRRSTSSTYAALSVLDSEHPNTSPVLRLVTQLCLTLCNPMDYSLLGSPVHGDSPGRNSEVVCHALPQGIFLTQGLKPGLPHCKQILCHLSHQGSPVPPFVCNRNMHSLGKDRIPCGEGNGTPLQYSCLENPMDGGAS